MTDTQGQERVEEIRSAWSDVNAPGTAAYRNDNPTIHDVRWLLSEIDRLKAKLEGDEDA